MGDEGRYPPTTYSHEPATPANGAAIRAALLELLARPPADLDALERAGWDRAIRACAYRLRIPLSE